MTTDLHEALLGVMFMIPWNVSVSGAIIIIEIILYACHPLDRNSTITDNLNAFALFSH